MGAREIFRDSLAPSAWGQVFPLALGELICAKHQPPEEREPVDVRVYWERPAAGSRSAGLSGRAAADCGMGGARRDHPRHADPELPARSPAPEKGIDVSLALDYVVGSVDCAFDIGTIFSTDTDLVPALEFVARRPELGVTPEVAAWQAEGANPLLRVQGASVWRRRLMREDYERARDRRRYVGGAD